MLVLMTLNFMVSTPIMCIGGIIFALREDAGLSWLVWVSVAVLFVVVGVLVCAAAAAVPPDAGPHRRHQRRAARADRRHPRGARLRPRAVRDRSATTTRTRRSPASRCKVGNIFVLMFPVIMMILQRGDRRRALVRRPPGRRGRDADRLADRVPAVPAADPDRGDDGRLHGHDDPARGRLRRAHRRGARAPSRAPQCRGGERRACPTDGRVEFAGRHLRLPGRREAGADDVVVHRRARPADRDRRLDRLRQDHARLASSPPVTTRRAATSRIDGVPVDSPRAGSQTRRRRSVSCRSSRTCSPGTIASNLRFGRPDATDDELWEALRVAQARGLRPRQGARARRARSRRAAPTSPAASGSGSASPGRSSRGPRSTCSTTRSRRSTSRPTRDCARPSPTPPATRR